MRGPIGAADVSLSSFYKATHLHLKFWFDQKERLYSLDVTSDNQKLNEEIKLDLELFLNLSIDELTHFEIKAKLQNQLFIEFIINFIIEDYTGISIAPTFEDYEINASNLICRCIGTTYSDLKKYISSKKTCNEIIKETLCSSICLSCREDLKQYYLEEKLRTPASEHYRGELNSYYLKLFKDNIDDFHMMSPIYFTHEDILLKDFKDGAFFIQELRPLEQASKDKWSHAFNDYLKSEGIKFSFEFLFYNFQK
jgi:bacterioferritin-associated ferredoxin